MRRDWGRILLIAIRANAVIAETGGATSDTVVDFMACRAIWFLATRALPHGRTLGMGAVVTNPCYMFGALQATVRRTSIADHVPPGTGPT